MNGRLFIRRVLDAGTCARIRAAMDAGTTESAEILENTTVTDASVRRAASIEVAPAVLKDVERLFESLRHAITTFYGVRLAEREGPGFLRYGAGGFYRAHRDRGHVPSWPAAARRTVSIVVFLNSASDTPDHAQFTGGTLRLLDVPYEADVVPVAGLLVAFPADVLHEVTPVGVGTRDTIVDWFYDPATGSDQ